MNEMNQINQELLRELPGEMKGALNYHNMAATAKESGNEKEAAFLFAIAKDEMQHAAWIHDHLLEAGVKIPDDVEATYQKYKSAHKF